MRRATYGAHCPFFSPLTGADVDAAERDGARESVRRFNALFSGAAAHFAFVVVGACSPRELLPLVGRYLATLPPAPGFAAAADAAEADDADAGASAAAAADDDAGAQQQRQQRQRPDARRVAPLRFEFPAGPPPVRVDVPCAMSHAQARSSHAQIVWPVALPRAAAREGVVWCQLAARVLEARLLRAMRFDRGQTYGVSVTTFFGAEAPSAPADRPVRGELAVAFTCEPAARERLLSLGVRTLAALQGPLKEEGEGEEGAAAAGAKEERDEPRARGGRDAADDSDSESAEGDADDCDDRPPTKRELATALRLERLGWEESQETNSFWHDVLSTAYQSRQYSETEEQGGGKIGDGDLAAVHARTVAARRAVRRAAAADPLALRRAVRELLPLPCADRYAAVAMVPRRAAWGPLLPLLLLPEEAGARRRRLLLLGGAAAAACAAAAGAWFWFGRGGGDKGEGGASGSSSSAKRA